MLFKGDHHLPCGEVFGQDAVLDFQLRLLLQQLLHLPRQVRELPLAVLLLCLFEMTFGWVGRYP